MTRTTSELELAEEELPLEAVDCYLCGSAEGVRMFEDPPFEVKRCGCGFVYVTPRVPDDKLHLIYQTNYFKSTSAKDFGYSDYTLDRDLYLKTFAKKARIVQRFKPAGRVLEVGSAAGFFLRAMRDRGYDVHGVEVSRYVAEFARDELGIETVFNGRLADAPLEPESFDVVAMWDVIEHLADPIAELERMRALMRPDGALFIQTQDVSALTARVLGKKWLHFKQLEHIYHFDPRTIQRALDRAGFEIVHVTHTGTGKYISVDFFIERMQRYSRLLHLMLKPARVFGRRYFYLSPRDEMIVVARPKPKS